MTELLRLGVNIDHVATIRNARGGRHPDPVRAAKLAAAAGADGITAHLREDRRHISDADILKLSSEIDLPLNLEMAATDEMLAIALRHKPHAACLVPEKREERTTEGGLDVVRGHDSPDAFRAPVARHRDSRFPVRRAGRRDAARRQGARRPRRRAAHRRLLRSLCPTIRRAARSRIQLERIRNAAAQAEALGLECHAGHGLGFETVKPVAAIPTIVELNIGHFLVGEAIFIGLDAAIRRMRVLMDEARGLVDPVLPKQARMP